MLHPAGRHTASNHIPTPQSQEQERRCCYSRRQPRRHQKSFDCFLFLLLYDALNSKTWIIIPEKKNLYLLLSLNNIASKVNSQLHFTFHEVLSLKWFPVFKDVVWSCRFYSLITKGMKKIFLLSGLLTALDSLFVFFLQWDWDKESMQEQTGFVQAWQEIYEEKVIKECEFTHTSLEHLSLLDLAEMGKKSTLLQNTRFCIL